MEFGYSGNILRVDLTRNKISIDQPEEIFYRRYIGGEGFIAYYLLKEVPKAIDPFDKENKLVFANGPLTGTNIPGSGRNTIGAKSPLTGGFASSEVGGYWGAELKHAGFDTIIIEGKSDSPVYLHIHDNDVEIMDATNLWGKSTGDTTKQILQELNNKYIRIACIGLAAENLVRYSCIINDIRSAAGRSGMGAVMGSKKLKAIAVKGNNKPKIYNKEKVKNILKESYDAFINYSKFFAFGTGGNLIERFAQSGNLPTRNFRDGNFKHAKEIDPVTFSENIDYQRDTCYACPIRCKKTVSFNEPLNVDPIYGGPEYETIAAFGSNCGISDINAICKANEICNKHSIDTISAGVTISFAMECFEKGILTEKDTNGLQLNFGNPQAMLKLLELIINRQGIGKVLAEGVKKASDVIGKESCKFAIHVKGQEVPMHEPRLKQGLGVGYAVSPTGAEHMANFHDDNLLNNESVKSLAPFGIYETLDLNNLGVKKIKALLYASNWRIIENSLLICHFSPFTMNQENNLLTSVTGWNTSTWELMKSGERIVTMARIYNLSEGFNKKDDWLPERFFKPHTTGSLSNTSIDSKQFQKAREIYYQLMGWNTDGIPTRVKLEELDIEWVHDLERSKNLLA